MNKTITAIVSGSAVVVLAAGYFLASALFTPNYPPVPTVAAAAVVATHPDTATVATLVNDERVKAGLPVLADDPRLDASAATKCADMVAKDYWDHNDPSGQEPWHFITEQGYSYRYAGENLAYGFPTSSGLVDGWMNSPGHRANILKADFTTAGYALCHSDNYQHSGSQDIIVQHLVG